MSAPGRSASTTTAAALALSAGAGAAAATSLLLAWSWWQQGRRDGGQAEAQRQRHTAAVGPPHAEACTGACNPHSHPHSFLTVPLASGGGGGGGGVGGRGRAGSASRSRARVVDHTRESSRLSECSYLEDREYEYYEQLAEEDEEDGHALDHGDADGHASDHPSMYMCPHCSNYINPSELIVPSFLLDEDGNPLSGDEGDEEGGAAGLDRAHSVQAARILSAAEQLSIQQALRDSLQQIFVSVDEDGDGLITRDEMGAFLKKLGLTGEREAAFLNIIGGDSVQPQPFAPLSAAPTPDAKSGASGAHIPSGDKRGSHSSHRGSGIGGGAGSGSGPSSHNGSLSGPRFGGSGPGGGVKVGINFRQFFERFQDTLEGMDALNVDAGASDDEAAVITTNPVHLDASAAFSPAAPSASASSDSLPALAASPSPATAAPVAPASSNSSKSSAPFPEASLLFTPPRSSSLSSASSSRLTVNTTTTPSSSGGGGGGGSSATGGPPASTLHPPLLSSSSSSTSSSSTLHSPMFSPSSASAAAAASASAASPSIRVFLGGACGDTTWRADVAIPQLTAAGVSFYDPQVKDWSPKLVALEGLMKAWCKILFFVIGKTTRALASMIEVAALIAAGRKVVLVVEPIEPGVEIEGQIPSSSEVKDLNRARSYLRDVASNYNIPVHSSADAGIKAIIAMEEEEKKEMRARLQLMRENSLGGGSGGGGGAPGSATSSASGGGHRASFSVSRPRGRGSVLLNGAALTLALAQSSPNNPHSSPPQSAGASASSAGGSAHSMSGHKKMHANFHTLPQPLPGHRDAAAAAAAAAALNGTGTGTGCAHRHTLSTGNASLPSTPTHAQLMHQRQKSKIDERK